MMRLTWHAPVIAVSLAAAPMVRAEDNLPPITRDQVMANAAAYAHQTWRSGAANLHVSCSSSWNTTYTAGSYVGLPYKWGGFDDLAAFQQKLSQGYGPGSRSEYGVLPCVTGVDCSGFLSRVWQLPSKYGTATLSQVTTEIRDIDDVRPGDAWVKPGSHVVLHAYFRDDGTPTWSEASGGAEKVRLMTSGSWAYLNGYRPVRYKGIRETADLSHAGTLEDPIPIPSFPFTDSRNTVLAASDEIDEYPCKPGTREEGPEFVYAADLPGPGKLTATLAYTGGVELGAFLLSGNGPETCVAHANRKLGYEVKAPRRYLLVVDGYSKAQDEFSGPYTLTVSFAAPGTTSLPAPDAGTAGSPAKSEGCHCSGGAGGLAVLLAAACGSGWRRRRLSA